MFIKKEDYSLKVKAICIIGMLLYKVILDYSFVKWIAPVFSYYMRLQYIANNNKVIISYVLLLIVLVITEFNEKRFSDVFMAVELIVMYIPMLSLYAYSDRSTAFMLVITISYCIQEAIIRLSRTVCVDKEIVVSGSASICLEISILALIGGAMLYSLINYGMGSLAAMDLMNVYSIREGVGYSFPFSYIIPWVFKVVCVFVIVLGMYRKQIILFLVGFIPQFYLYLIYANKSTLFSLGLVILVYYLYSRWDIIKSLVYGLAGMTLASGVFYSVTGNIYPISLMVRRTLFVPATIKFSYYDFFKENELLYFADNSIGKLFGVTSKYTMEAPKLIASYLGVPDSHCNSGYWGDAYANYGMAGVVIFSVILVLIVLLVERISKGVPTKVVYPILIILFYYLNDSALLTWLLGGGAGLVIVFIWLLKNATGDEVNLCFKSIKE